VLVAARSGLDRHRQHLTRPAMLERLVGIPVSLLWILHLVKQGTEIAPWYLCSRLLSKLRVRSSLHQCAHIFQVAWGKSAHVWKRCFQVSSKLV
jgi:hypothetical protein